jgi:hypothetical protein
MVLSLSPVERHEKPLVVSGRPNGKSFMAKWQTYLAKHTHKMHLSFAEWKPHGINALFFVRNS